MDFFKSVFSTDPEPSTDPEDEEQEEDLDQGEDLDQEDHTLAPEPAAAATTWNFGGIIKTFASKSESVIQTYRRDLEEFGSGFKKETAAIRDVAARAVLDLPGSLEAGASAAQESLESVGQAIDDIGVTVWRGTAEIISQGKVALLSTDSDANLSDLNAASESAVGSSKRYSRFDAQVVAIQSDPSTFLDEPEDGEDFGGWKSGFDLGAKEEEIEILCYENGNLEGLFEKMVPGVVDYDTFWSRYYYRVYKLKQAEDARATLVKRVISREEEEEELSWEVDDDEEGEGEKKKIDVKAIKEEKEECDKIEDQEIVKAAEEVEENRPAAEVSQVERVDDSPAIHEEEAPTAVGNVEAPSLVGTEEAPSLVGKEDGEDMISKAENKVTVEAKADPGESSKDSDFSVVSSQPSMPEEDDLGWDEIEDLGENDDKKAITSDGTPNKVDLRKRLSAAEDDEDLSWDIEDDDDPAKP